MSNIIITGISSFIGIHLAKYFSRNSYNVIGTISRDISKYDGIRKVRIAEALNSEVRIEKLDITSDLLKLFYGTDDKKHPGVEEMINNTGYII